MYKACLLWCPLVDAIVEPSALPNWCIMPHSLTSFIISISLYKYEGILVLLQNDGWSWVSPPQNMAAVSIFWLDMIYHFKETMTNTTGQQICNAFIMHLAFCNCICAELLLFDKCKTLFSIVSIWIAGYMWSSLVYFRFSEAESVCDASENPGTHRWHRGYQLSCWRPRTIQCRVVACWWAPSCPQRESWTIQWADHPQLGSFWQWSLRLYGDEYLWQWERQHWAHRCWWVKWQISVILVLWGTWVDVQDCAERL